MKTRGLAKGAIFAVADQTIASAANLVANAALIRYATKENYGQYVVAFSTLLLIYSTVCVFSLQMTFLAPHRPENRRRAFCADLRSAQNYVSVAVAGVAFAVVLGAAALGILSVAAMRFGIIVALGSILVSQQEYYRSLLYLFGREQFVVISTGIQLLVWLATIYLGWQPGYISLGETFLVGYCLGAAAAAGIGRLVSGLPKPESWTAVCTSTKEAWAQGSWSMAGGVIATLQGQSYAWLLAVLSGASAAAEANFGRLFFAPLSLMLMAVNRVARPALGELHASSGETAAIRAGRKLLGGILVLVAVYVPLVLATRSWVIEKSSAQEYANPGVLILAWGLVTCLQVTRWNSTLLLGALGRNRQMTSMQAMAALVGLAASLALIPLYGALGAIVSIGCGELVLTALMWRELNQTSTNSVQLGFVETT